MRGVTRLVVMLGLVLAVASASRAQRPTTQPLTGVAIERERAGLAAVGTRRIGQWRSR